MWKEGKLRKETNPEKVVHENALKSIIIYMQKFLHADWLRACQLISNSAKT